MSVPGRHSRQLAGMLLLCGMTALLWRSSGPLSAQTSSGLSVSLNAASFTPGETMVVRARLTPLTPSRLVDAYIVVQLPNGLFFSLQLDGSLVAGLQPIARNFIPFAFDAQLAQFYLPAGNVPAGRYTWFAALTEPGTLNFVGPLSQAVFTVDYVHRGRVLDYQTQSPVGGTVVRFTGAGGRPLQQETITDIGGTYSLLSAGFLFAIASVSVNDEIVGLVELTGANYHGELFVNWGTCVARYGRVIDSTLRPVVGATVTLLSVSTVTDLNGWYRIDLGCPASGMIGFNTTFLSVRHPQYAPADRIVGRGVSRVERLDVRLSGPQ